MEEEKHHKKKKATLELTKIPIHAEFMWSERPSEYIQVSKEIKVPEERSGHTATQYGNLMYIFGGAQSEPGATTKRFTPVCFNNLYEYDMQTMVFRVPNVAAGTRPEPRYRHSASIDEKSGDIYVFGGIGGGRNLYKLKTTAEPLYWEIITTSGLAPEERYGHVSCVYNNRLFVIGGRNTRNHNPLSDLFVLDLVSCFWKSEKASGDAPVDITLFSAQRIQSHLYLIGSDHRDTFESILHFNLDELSWIETKAAGTAPQKVTRAATCVYENMILVMGGLTPMGSIPRDISLLQVTEPNRLHWLDIAVLNKAPPSRYGHTVCVNGTSFFVFGGHNGNSITNEMNTLVHQMWNQCDVRNPNQGPSARIGASCSLIGNKLYVIGGAINNRSTNTVYIYQIEKGIWDSPPMYGNPPTALTGHCAVAVGSEIFIFGGGDGESPINDLHVIDTSTNKWLKPEVEGNKPEGGIGCSMVAFGMKIVIFGGFGAKQYTNDLTILSTSSMAWTHPTQRGDFIPTPRVGHSAVMIGSDMYVFGGSFNGVALRETWCLNVKTLFWTKFENEGELPYPRFGHTAVTVGNKIYIFGGCVRTTTKATSLNSVADYRQMVSNDLRVLEPIRQVSKAMWSRPVIGGTAPVERYRHVMVVWNGKIYILTGSQGGASIWELDTGHYELQDSDQRYLRKDQADVEAGGQKRELAGEVLEVVSPSKQKVLDFLQELNLPKYTRIFLKQEVDWKTLLRCNDQDLVDMGVTALGPRKKIMKRLNKINTQKNEEKKSLKKKKKNDKNNENNDKFGVEGKKDDKNKKDDVDDDNDEEEDDDEFGLLVDVNNQENLKKKKPLLFQERYAIEENETPFLHGGSASSLIYAIDLKTKREVVIKFVKEKDSWERELKYLRSLRSPEQFVVELIDFMDKENRRKAKISKKEQNKDSSKENENSNNGPNNNENQEKKETQENDTFIETDAYDPYPQNNLYWMVLERGKMSLRNYFKEIGVMNECQRRALIERILVILAHIHRCGVVHLDVKPENFVFFGEEMKLKIIDFGFSCNVDEYIAPVSSPSYCSPEMAKIWVSLLPAAQKKIKASPSMDIWAFGMIFFESYIGHPVLTGREDTYGLIARDDGWIDNLSWRLIDNIQALHLLEKILSLKPKSRPSADKLLESAYMTWGLDSAQIRETFGLLQDSCEQLKKEIELVEKDVASLQ